MLSTARDAVLVVLVVPIFALPAARLDHRVVFVAVGFAPGLLLPARRAFHAVKRPPLPEPEGARALPVHLRPARLAYPLLNRMGDPRPSGSIPNMQ